MNAGALDNSNNDKKNKKKKNKKKKNKNKNNSRLFRRSNRESLLPWHKESDWESTIFKIVFK